VFVSATDATITIRLDLNVVSYGVQVSNYELQISTDGVTYTAIETYDGISPLWTLKEVEDSLVPGKIYRIRIRAQNGIGWGPESADLLAAMTSAPGIP
jgi:hypothetical protein